MYDPAAPLLQSTVGAVGETHALVRRNFDGDHTRQTVLYVFVPLTLLGMAILFFNIWRIRQVLERHGSNLVRMRYETAKNLTDIDNLE